MMAAELVTVGFQVEVEDKGKRVRVGRIYHAQSAAQQLRDLYSSQGISAWVVGVQKFERERKEPK